VIGNLRVLFVPFCGGAVAGSMTPLKWKRLAVWDNAERNKTVADLAEGLATNARKALRKLGVKFKDAKLPDRVCQRVVIRAETAEQARRLGKLLPAWDLQDAIPVENEHEDLEEVHPDGDKDPPPGRIATLVYAATYGINCDVLVRATAGTGKLSWGCIKNGGGRMGSTPALVVDVEDQTGKREVKDSETRRREYKEQGLKELTPTRETQNT